MNKQIESIISRYHVAKKFSGINLNLQSATVHEIVFYNLQEDGLALFKERLKQSDSKLVFVPLPLDEPLVGVVSVPAEIFFHLQVKLCDIFYPIQREMKFIGVTGTNGKTTVAFLGAQILQKSGINSGAIGTLGLSDGLGNILNYHKTTTPSYIDFRRELYQITEETSITHLFIELSSHALIQKRLGDLSLSSAGWTNFTQDHLDYHKSEEEYFKAKLQILDLVEQDKFAIADEKLLAKRLEEYLSSICIAKEVPTQVMVQGDFFTIEHNVKNLALACKLIELVGIEITPFSTETLRTPPGRLDAIELANGGIAYVDFAHTPDALENVCAALKQSNPYKKLYVLFGCGGDRDRSKRPLMGAAVEKYADKIFITSDNPRSEDPEKIIDEIVIGINGDYYRESNRSKSIAYAVSKMNQDVILLIAGKGHEDYQEICGVKYPYSDYQVLEEFR